LRVRVYAGTDDADDAILARHREIQSWLRPNGQTGQKNGTRCGDTRMAASLGGDAVAC
jgi:hypothetical protein